MKNWKSYISVTLLISSLILVLSFSRSEQLEKVCTGIKIQIDHHTGNFFVEEEDIHAMVYHEIDTVVGRLMMDINSHRLEHKISNHPSIEKAEIYKTINGELRIQIQQRRPIVRIFNAFGESFYLDSQAEPMPISSKFTSRVLVASGYITAGLVDAHQIAFQSEGSDTADEESKILYDVHTFAAYIHKDDFWNAQIEQLYVNKEMEIELIPRVGNHRIVFGDATSIEKKFNKLKIFYHEGLDKTGWNEYSVINLKYANQVVCKKKY